MRDCWTKLNRSPTVMQAEDFCFSNAMSAVIHFEYTNFTLRTVQLRFSPNSEVEFRYARSAGFPACGFWRLSSRQFPRGNTGLESPVNPQTGMSALQHVASAAPLATSESGFSHGRKMIQIFNASFVTAPADAPVTGAAISPAHWR